MSLDSFVYISACQNKATITIAYELQWMMQSAGSGRWADTYLLSEEDLSPAMSQAFGPAGNGPAVLAALVQVAGTLLGGQAGEVELHTAVCTRLLSVLVRRRHVSHRLVQLQPWHNLAGRT